MNEIAWALNKAAGRPRNRWRPRLQGVGVFGGITVITAARALPYGHSADRRGNHRRRCHVVDVVYTAWRRGRHVGTLARWACGSTSRCVQLLAERPAMPACHLCVATLRRRLEHAEQARDHERSAELARRLPS